MKLLLDESVPRLLRTFFRDPFEIRTVPRIGWAGSKNGDLLQLAADHGFDALVTADQGIEFQQNLDRLPIPVVIMIASRTRVRELTPLVAEVVDIVTGELQRRIYRVVG